VKDAIEKVREYTKLRDRQRELGAAHDEVKAAADLLEQELLDEFAQQGVDNIRVDGHTVYLHRQTWASPSTGHDSTDVVAALKAAGLDHMVAERYNSNTLSAYVRELVREDAELPASLQAVVQTTDKFSLRVRRAG
jgi:hypothetical protein